MNRPDSDERLSRISTHWSDLVRAHAGGPGASTVQASLLQRYSGPVYRYLLATVGDADAAEDLAQEFALRFLRGDFRGADPGRGRFRHYLKTALRRLTIDHHRHRQQAPRPLAQEPAAPTARTLLDSENAFTARWREELLDATWDALRAVNESQHLVLRCRVENPEWTSARIGEWVSSRRGQAVTPDWVRKTLQRAQHKYAQLLVGVVSRSLEGAGGEELRQELQELDLLRYCRSVLGR